MPVYRRHRMKLLVVSYCVSEVLILPIASVHASNRCLCSNTADHRGSKEPQSPRANVQRYSRATTSIPHINGPDDIPHSITTKPSLFYSVQLPLNRNNNNTIRPRIRNLRQDIPTPNLLISKKSLIVLVNSPRDQASRRSRIRAAPPRIRPLETSGFGAIEQVLIVCALEGFCGFFGTL